MKLTDMGLCYTFNHNPNNVLYSSATGDLINMYMLFDTKYFVTSTNNILDTVGKEFHAFTFRIIKTVVNNLKFFIKRCCK